MKRCILLSLLISICLVAGCGPSIYISEEFPTYLGAHKTVAILPFQVIIDPGKLPKDWTTDMAHEAEQKEASVFQSQLYMKFLERQKKMSTPLHFKM